MPDKKGNLYLFEAIELRGEYDRHIKLLQDLIEETGAGKGGLFSRKDDEEREPAADFDLKKLEERLKKLQTKRVKLNQGIQKTNFETQIDYNGEKISIAEALEIRKNLLADKKAISESVMDSACKRIIYKEERDIVHEPKRPFKETYKDFQKNLRNLRHLANQIHIANHKSAINFKDE